jgi:hypothetical protein
MPQENISFSQLLKANATSPQLPEIYIYRTDMLQRDRASGPEPPLMWPISLPQSGHIR